MSLSVCRDALSARRFRRQKVKIKDLRMEMCDSRSFESDKATTHDDDDDDDDDNDEEAIRLAREREREGERRREGERGRGSIAMTALIVSGSDFDNNNLRSE